MTAKRGKLIVFEGADGVGKSTVVAAAAARIQDLGFEVVLTKDPGGTPLGDAIREEMFRKFKIKNMAPGVVDCLMLASHLQVTYDVVLPALMDGKIVVADRYWYSEAPYASVRRPWPPVPILEAYGKMHGPSADALFLLIASTSEIARRNSERADASRQLAKSWDKIEDQVEVQRKFISLCSNLPETILVDADPPAEVVRGNVLRMIDEKIEEWGML